MKDDEFVGAFERGTLPPAAFRHGDHVRLTWIYLVRHGGLGAERRLLAGLQAFAERAGKPEKFDPSLTRAWIAAIDAARAAHATFEEMVAARPELLSVTR
ncbi:MAG: hypothetical protein ACRD15_23495 [Vicinamibacterales bacterium]